ncbi:MAG: TolC family protein [Treponema sp.]|jgi:outer membrane protein TolC|nr:TolC family protein [Treponema sp.]
MVSLCFVLQFGAAARVNAETELGPEEAVSLALENNLNLKKSLLDLGASGYSEKNLWSEIFPSISTSASIGYGSPVFSGSGFEFNDRSLSYRIGLGVNLGLNAGIPYSIKNIKLAHQSDILKYEDARNQLSIRVTRNYYSLIAEKNNLDYLGEILNLAEKQYEKSEVSFKNGLAGELALLQSKLAVENARYALSAAAIVYANNIGEFLAVLGMAQDEKVSLLGEIKIIRIEADAQELIVRYLPGRPDMLRGLQEIERLEYGQKQAVLQGRAPSLNLSLDWNGSNFDPFTDRFDAAARLSIPIDPWIPGTPKEQSFKRAGDAVEKARLDLTITEDSAKTQIRSLTALLRNSWDSIEIARLRADIAERSYQLTEQGFRNGTVESLALEDARNNMADARQRLLLSELSYFNMTLDLASALNIGWEYLMETYGVKSEKK